MNQSKLPGLSVAIGIALVATLAERALPIPLVGASIIALFIGMGMNSFAPSSTGLEAGLTFTSKTILKFAIVLLGASLSIGTILEVGKLSLSVMFFTLLTCFGGGYFVGKALKLDWKLSNLISAGTGICGGSAIAAIAPVIDAKESDIAYAMSATFLFDVAMILLFPLMGRALGMSNQAYGLWAGTAINDTSSVVAAGYAFSEAAGDFATMVKLTRTLSIIPTVLIFSAIQYTLTQKKTQESPTQTHKNVSLLSLFPWFIVLFVGMALLNSAGWIPSMLSRFLKQTSKFLMVAALAAIGLKTDLKEMRQSGLNPMFHGFIISALVVVVALGVEKWMGLL